MALTVLPSAKGANSEPLGGGDIVGAVPGKDRGQHVLEHGKYIILRGESHLHVELIELAGGAVAARVLIPEAGGDLEIAVKAGGHEKLFELLGRLGQGVELAGVLSRRDQVVARTLGTGGREDGRRDLQEAVLGHGLAQGRHDVAAEDNILFDCGIAQIKIAVLEALSLIGLTAAVDFKGQLVIAAAAENLDLLGHDLDIAGGELGVLAVALTHDTLHGDRGLLVDALDDAHHVLILDDHLGGAVEVAHDDEGEIIADLAHILHPADDLDLLADVLNAQLAAGVGTGLCHRLSIPFHVMC